MSSRRYFQVNKLPYRTKAVNMEMRGKHFSFKRKSRFRFKRRR